MTMVAHRSRRAVEGPLDILRHRDVLFVVSAGTTTSHQGIDMTTIAEYARDILAIIDIDIRDGILPADVKTFEDLNDHVDANGYLEEAGVPYAPTTANSELTVAIQEEVAALLSAR